MVRLENVKFYTRYFQLISKAEQWAIWHTKVQVILCTCAVAGSPKLEFGCDNLVQCIVDECGMCLEPETLIPMTCKNIEQIVLIGDHKQLQPVIKDNTAKSLGLQKSMFERLSSKAIMLQRQYRMVRRQLKSVYTLHPSTPTITILSSPSLQPLTTTTTITTPIIILTVNIHKHQRHHNIKSLPTSSPLEHRNHDR